MISEADPNQGQPKGNPEDSLRQAGAALIFTTSNEAAKIIAHMRPDALTRERRARTLFRQRAGKQGHVHQPTPCGLRLLSRPSTI